MLEIIVEVTILGKRQIANIVNQDNLRTVTISGVDNLRTIRRNRIGRVRFKGDFHLTRTVVQHQVATHQINMRSHGRGIFAIH